MGPNTATRSQILMRIKPRFIDLALAGGSALLLIVSFPKFDLGGFAWVALVPLLLALDRNGLKGTLLLCYVTGFVSFAGIFSCIWHIPEVNLLDMILIYGYLGPYAPVIAVI